LADCPGAASNRREKSCSGERLTIYSTRNSGPIYTGDTIYLFHVNLNKWVWCSSSSPYHCKPIATCPGSALNRAKASCTGERFELHTV